MFWGLMRQFYVGLTNDLVRRWREHDCPPDFHWVPMRDEASARFIEKRLLAQSGNTGGPGGGGWKFLYWFACTDRMRQCAALLEALDRKGIERRLGLGRLRS